jgi:hypothetical protein
VLSAVSQTTRSRATMLLISDLMLETRMQLQPVINPLLTHYQAQD